jgi:iodotyrosine deiodinase
VKAARFVPAPKIDNRSDKELIDRAREFYATMQKRRTVRDFSDRPVPREVIEHCIRAAGAAPSGANLQPWHFVAITDPKVKREIRVAAEAEEKEFYEHRAPKAWLEALAPLGTDWHKPFLETAPWLIAIFAQPVRIFAERNALAHILCDRVSWNCRRYAVTAVHSCGLVSLTHTPSPMGF